MITVRFPTGVSIQYNDARWALRNGDGSTNLFTRRDGDWIATVPTAGCVVEGVRACRIYDAVAGDRAEQVLQNIEGLPGRTLRQLKSRLRRFNSKRQEWKK